MANAFGDAAVQVAGTVAGYAAQRTATELRLALQMLAGAVRIARPGCWWNKPTPAKAMQSAPSRS